MSARLSPYFSHTYDTDSLTHRSRSVKIWDLPRLEDLNTRRVKRKLPIKKSSEPVIPAVDELLKLIKKERKPQSLPSHSQPRPLKRGLVRTYTRPHPRSADRSHLIISSKDTVSGSTLRHKLVFRAFAKKAAVLQPLHVANGIGQSEPCFRVMNYSVLEPKSSEDRVTSSLPTKPVPTPVFPPVTTETAQGKLMRKNHSSVKDLTEVRTQPLKPSVFRRQISRRGGLQGWDISPVNISPMGEPGNR